MDRNNNKSQENNSNALNSMKLQSQLEELRKTTLT